MFASSPLAKRRPAVGMYCSMSRKKRAMSAAPTRQAIHAPLLRNVFMRARRASRMRPRRPTLR